VSNYKYTSDGKKVVVLGMLNNVESIVQEIFITASGDEIPSGEKFTTKSLHDAPVISYAMKTEKELQGRIADEKATLERLKKESRDLENKLKAQKDSVNTALASIRNMPTSALRSLRLFLSGKANYVLVNDYIDAPKRFDETIEKYDNNYHGTRYDSLRLLGLYGDTKGNLEFQISDYSDGSGSRRDIIPYETYEEALAVVKARAMTKHTAKNLDAGSFARCVEMGIVFEQSMVEHYTAVLKTEYESAKANLNRQYDESRKHTIEKYERQISALAKNGAQP
jgi:hypothetical protein